VDKHYICISDSGQRPGRSSVEHRHPSPRPVNPCSRTSPTANDINPFGEAGSFLALNVDDVSIAAATAAHAILSLGVPVLPVVVLLKSLLGVERCLLKVGLARKLPRWGIGGAVLDGGVSVTEVAEVVDVLGTEKDTGR
jgi:hypothetical protein